MFCVYSVFYTTLLATGRSRDQLRLGAYLATVTAIGVAGGTMFRTAGVGIGVGVATIAAAPWYFRLARTKWGSAQRISLRPWQRRSPAPFLCAWC
jgi:hypothetical protein